MTVSSEVEKNILLRSRRRCCICFGLHRKSSTAAGQIAHLDRDRTNDAEENLAFLCLEHHDQYDSSTSQSKNFTIREVKAYREELYKGLEEGLFSRAKLPLDDGEREQTTDLGYGIRFYGGFAELFIRNMSSKKTLRDVTAIFANYSNSLKPYDPQDLQWHLVAVGDVSPPFTMPPGDVRYLRFATLVGGKIQIVGGDKPRMPRHDQFVAKFNIRMSGATLKPVYTCVTLAPHSTLTFSAYKRNKKEDRRLSATAQKHAALVALGEIWERGVHLRDSIAGQRIFLSDHQTKVSEIEREIEAQVAIVEPAELSDFRVIGDMDPRAHPQDVNPRKFRDDIRPLIFSERLRRAKEFRLRHLARLEPKDV